MTRLNLVLLLAVIASSLYLVRTQYESRRLFTEIDRAQAPHLDPGATIDSPAGTRSTTTVRNEPINSPNTAAYATTRPIDNSFTAFPARDPRG